MAIPSFSSTVIARAAAAIYGLQLGNGTMNSVLNEVGSTGVDALVNGVYNRDFASVSNANVAAMVVANLGITGAGTAGAVAYMTGQLDAAGPANEGMAIANAAALFAGLTADATYGAAATAFNNRIATAVAYSQQDGTVDRSFGAGSTVAMTLGQDFLTGTSGSDTIIARIFDNNNTLQSGDWVDGGAGSDRLEADLGTSAFFSITPETTGVETFSVRAQSSNFNDSGDNNVANEDHVIVDAQRMSGVTRFDSSESRADLIIEDVRTSLRTKDITIGMMGTDAGNVDYAVYFDTLRADGSSVATLTIELMDTRAATSTDAATAATPLKDSPFNGFSFVLNGKTIALRDPADAVKTDPTTFNGAQTYPQLLAAIQKMLTAPANLALYPELEGVSAALGPTFEARDTLTGQAATGTTIVLSGSSTAAVTLAAGNFIADDGVPPSSGLHTVQSTATSSSTDLITSTVVLDNVGRGSNGGDLVIGAMSVGETSSSAGIAKFDITVENSSNLGIIASTNNALKEVVVVNGAVKGNLRVQGFDNTTSLVDGAIRGDMNNTLPGAVAQHNAYGFNDVRLINMSAMTGTVSFDAAVTAASFAKYIQLTDRDSDPKVDNNSTDGKTTRQVADFEYSGGTANDTIAVVIDNAVISSHSNVNVGREDFTFVINGNGGDDTISTVIGFVDRNNDGGDDGADGDTTAGENDDTSYLAGGANNWYEHQGSFNNLTINAGEGNDTVRTPGSGDAVINLGTGNDVVYTDNTGALNTSNAIIRNEGRAIWVYNSNDQAGALAPARFVDDIESDRNDNWFMYRSELTVTFLGDAAPNALESISVPIGFNAANFRSSDLHINQAIKTAINTDPVLKALLIAEDGPGNSLVVRSLIDGVLEATDLRFDIVLPEAARLTGPETKRVAEAWRGLVELSSPAWDALDAIASDPTPDGADLLAFMNSDTGDDASFEFTYGTFDGVAAGSQGYDAALGVAFEDDGAGGLALVDLAGANSVGTTTDNVISGDAGDDVIVLSTTDDLATTLGSSNEIVKYAGSFGNDTIVNFQEDDAGGLQFGDDDLDLTALGGFGSSGVLNLVGAIDNTDVGDEDDGTIIVHLEVDPLAFEDITVTTVKALFADNGLGNDVNDLDNDGDLAEELPLETFVYVAVDEHNVGHVYSVVDNDGTDGTNVAVNFMGTIDLADTDWTLLLASNFIG